MLQLLQSHLDKVGTYARILFVDFSSTFNTIQPHLMIKKLMDRNVNSELMIWIYKFLTGRQQYIRFKDAYSKSTIINTGAPQGCVLSASLFTIYVSDNGSNNERCTIIKYADDTVIIGLLDQKDDLDDNFYTAEVDHFCTWCQDNFLDLNVKKTKEMIIDYRVNKPILKPINIKGQDVDVVDKYKYLGTIVDNKLTGNENIDKIDNKANQRLYFVRKLKKCHVETTILSLFHKSIVESVLTFCMLCWYGNSSLQTRSKLKPIVSSAKRIGCDASDLQELYECLIRKKAQNIVIDTSHPLNHYFITLPLNRRFNAILCRMEQFRRFFVLAAVRHMNS